MEKLNVNIRRTQFSLVLMLLLVVVSSQTYAASSANLSCTGTVTGIIPGSSQIVGREGTSEVISSNYQLSVPLDPATGQRVGQAVHRPLIITKHVDAGSPYYLQALARSEVLACTLTIYKIDSNGSEVGYYEVRVTGAKLVGLNVKQTLNNTTPPSPDTETLAIRYANLTVFDPIGSVLIGVNNPAP